MVGDGCWLPMVVCFDWVVTGSEEKGFFSLLSVRVDPSELSSESLEKMFRFSACHYELGTLGDKIQGPSWGQQEE